MRRGPLWYYVISRVKVGLGAALSGVIGQGAAVSLVPLLSVQNVNACFSDILSGTDFLYDAASNLSARPVLYTMRAELIGHFEPCMTEIYLHMFARMADYIRTHPYISSSGRQTSNC